MKATEPQYPGEFKSAIARAKRVLLAANMPWSTSTGRYAPFGGNTKKTTFGVHIRRIGCSSTIALHVREPRYSSSPEATATASRASGTSN